LDSQRICDPGAGECAHDIRLTAALPSTGLSGHHPQAGAAGLIPVKYPSFLFVLLAASKIHAGDWERMRPIQPQGYVCHRASTPLVVDGRIDEASWAAAPWTADFQDIEGSAKPKPTFRTRAKMLWDDTYLYVAAEMEEPHVWATLTKRDSVIFQDPDFEVFIDPDGDNHEYYEFEMNALNTVWDLFMDKPYKDGGKALDSWDIAGLKSAVHVRGTLNKASDQDQGWTLEIAFPWKALATHAHRSAPPQEGDQWHVGFSRVEWDIETKENGYIKVPGRAEHNWVWSPQGIVDMHRPERWGRVQFTSKPPGTVTFQRDPAEIAKDALMGVYHAQRDFNATHQRWAKSMTELGLKPPAEGQPSPTITLTPDGYRADASSQTPTGKAETWSVRQDSKLWRQ
jgi:hypothetical protein